MSDRNPIASAIMQTLVSPNVADSNMEPANVVDVINRLARAAYQIADVVLPSDAGTGKDAAGVAVSSLTESVMGVTAGLCRIAEAINNLADAVREGQESP